MKRWMKGFFIALVTFIMSYCIMPMPAQAAATDIFPSVNSSSYISGYCYQVHERNGYRAYVYTDEACKNRNSREYVSAMTDECRIIGRSSRYNTVLVSYPTSAGRKQRWMLAQSFTSSGSGSRRYATSKINTYKFASSSKAYGSISSGDVVYVYETHGSYTRVLYPLSSGGYKLAWVKTSDADRYLSSRIYQSISDGTYVVASALNTSMVMDVYGGYTSNGTNIQLYRNGGGNNQKFKITSVGSGWYTIRNVASGKAIDVSGGVSRSGVNVQLWEYNGSAAQLWRFYSAGNGYYYIQNKLGYYLDVCGGNTNNETNIWVYTGNNSNAQKWKLSKTTATNNTGSNTVRTSTYYVNTTAGLVLRRSSSTSASKIMTMPYASAVSVYSISNGWAYLSYNGTKGYAYAAYLSKTKPNASATTLVRARLDQIAKGSLSYNSSTVMAVGRRFSGYRSNEQCKGYAKNVFYLCFGVTPGSTLQKPSNYLLSNTAGMTRVGYVTRMTQTNVSNLFQKARPGDFVQIRRSHGGSHSAIVYSVSSSGITFLEANLDGKNTVCKKTYSWSNLCSKNAAMSLYTASNYRLK